jgi:cytochrome o ubiquinol oxidase subunit 3
MSQAEILNEKQQAEAKTVFGFWVYLMTDCVLFASLFATFAVLRNNTYGGPGGGDIFNLGFVLSETLILLTSSFTCGLAILSARQGRKDRVLLLFGITFLLGLAFLGLELHEFSQLYHEGSSWRRSGFLSAFFTLVGTHVKRLTMLSLFWHFLDVIWIFIFTVVYLLGASL